MKIGLLIIAIYALVVIALASRLGGTKEKPKRISGRGGDFEE